MFVLTDSPPSSEVLLPATTAWRALRAGDLAAEDRALWRAVATGEALHGADLDDERRGSFWDRLVIVDEAPASQFDALRDLGRGGPLADRPVACLALSGRKFHGHRERAWVAERGNLHLSARIAPRLPAQQLLPALTMLPAVAAVEAVAAATGGRVVPGIKWVNDVLLDDRKICGVLTSTQTRQNLVEAAVLGVGLNVERAPAVPPTRFVPAVGCLAERQEAVDATLATVTWALLGRLGELYRELASSGPGALLERYRRASVIVGEHVRIYADDFGERESDGKWPAPIVVGQVERIEADLSLRLRGLAEPVTRGRLAFERVCQRFESKRAPG
jgi:biotin-[acetyl-CoA-carboxylase] ligase BirA-like protein